MTRTEVLEIIAQYAKEHEGEVIICAIGESLSGTHGQIVFGKPTEIVNMLFNIVKNTPPMAMILLDNVDILVNIATGDESHDVQ